MIHGFMQQAGIYFVIFMTESIRNGMKTMFTRDEHQYFHWALRLRKKTCLLLNGCGFCFTKVDKKETSIQP
jgi:hypothetical protein